jgi:hypothetical protein
MRSWGGADGTYPEHEPLLADSVGHALLVILDRLDPAERLALHDMFAVPFDEIPPSWAAPSLRHGSSPAAHADGFRERTRSPAPTAPASEQSSPRSWMPRAALTSRRSSRCSTRTSCSEPTQRSWPRGASAEVVGASAVATTFSGRAHAARPALVEGSAGAVWAPGGQPRVAFGFMIAHGKIVGGKMIADPLRLSELELVFLDE